MTSPRRSQRSFESIDDEHRTLRRLLERLRASMTLRGSMPDSLPALLDELADELKTHFEHEEVGGYFLGVVDRAPRLIGHVESLKHQHGELRSAARELAELAHRQKTNADDWPRLRTDCEDFVDQLLTHEAAENDLLQEAYTQDIGEED